MNNEKPKDGGPAFPNVFVDQSRHGVRHTVVVDGMSLRDWFAGMALQGLLAGIWKDSPATFTKEVCVNECYRWADAMLEERKKGTS